MRNGKHLAALVFAGALGTAVLGSGITALAATGWVAN